MITHIFHKEKNYLTFARDLIEQAYAEGARNFGIPGGTTPLSIVKSLRPKNIPDARFFLLDERQVPLNNPYSNLGSLQKAAPSLHIIGFAPKGRSHTSHLPKQGLDLTLIGIGSDGHIASLFPQHTHQQLFRTYIEVSRKNEIFKRISLGKSYLLRSRKIVLLASGPEKKEIITSFLFDQEKENMFPAMMLKNHEHLTLLYNI